MATAFDTIQMLFGGDTFNAKIKYQQDAIVSRTPIIILGNRNIFPKEEAFKCRMITYEWRNAPCLKDPSKKPYPLALYGLLEKYQTLLKISALQGITDILFAGLYRMMYVLI